MKNFIKKYFYTPVEILTADEYNWYSGLTLFWVSVTILLLCFSCVAFILWKFDLYIMRSIILYIIFTILVFYKYE